MNICKVCGKVIKHTQKAPSRGKGWKALKMIVEEMNNDSQRHFELMQSFADTYSKMELEGDTVTKFGSDLRNIKGNYYKGIKGMNTILDKIEQVLRGVK